MEKIPNIRAQLKKLEEKSKELHGFVFEAFKEVAEPKRIGYAAQLSDNFIYSIACGKQRAGFYSHCLLYMDGEINLYSMSFEKISHRVASWKSIEKFKNEIADHFK